MTIFQRLLNHKLAWIGIGIIACVALAAIFAPWIAPNDPLQVDLLRKLQSPSPAFPLGTDHLGRCILSRLIYGARISLSVAVAAMILGVTLGMLAGMTAGYFGGRVDALLMRLCDILLAFPQLILSLAIVGILGAGTFNIILALATAQWAWYARIMRGKVLRIKESNFVKAAIVSGTRSVPLMLKHVLPHAISEVIVLASLDLGVTILQISGLSFLGLGIQPPTPEWGAMINDGREFFRREPGVMLYPGMMIFITVLAFNLVGDALRDALDPRSSQRVRQEDLESKLQHQV
ncbi:ABC transporter permease subunit [Microcoleus sp. FACHB-1515]|uniref:nickel/cobalt ABC transporter permease n=1 Tax=Cyanophyceae TaxID=3028117 RepID=UPI001682A37F|nr:nickel/cobalt ABC transporter permease [Microcoleus sp. FACHB-1515]MBD2090197.1 ABC transporter permease subunit [Microcoleus sp. FACHB-1515]